MTEMDEQEMELHIQDAHASKLERDRISSAKYYQEHKAEVLKKKKLYQLEHADKIAETKIAYYDENKKEMLMKDKKYYKDNKEKISERKKIKIECGCGSNYNLSTKARHERTKKHMEYIECQESN
jgi:hypothetical protein